MSLSKPVKEAATPRTESPGRKFNFGLRTKPDELPEIKHNSLLELDDMMPGLALLAAIKNVVTSRCDGNIELERAQALRDWYTLTMKEGEDVVDYGRRSVKLCERLATTGVPEPQRPRL
jgi:hypothetical protein